MRHNKKIISVLLTFIVLVLAGCTAFGPSGKTSLSSKQKYYKVFKPVDVEGTDEGLWVNYDQKENTMQINCLFYSQDTFINTSYNPAYGDYSMDTYSQEGTDSQKIYLEADEDIIKIYLYDVYGVRGEEPLTFKCTFDSRFDK